MKYYVTCNKIFTKEDVFIRDELGNELVKVSFSNSIASHFLKLEVLETNAMYRLEVNKLKLKDRYQLLDQSENPILSVSIGLKMIHSITINQKKHFCKAAFFKIRYVLYDGYTELGMIKLIKQGKERVFEITLKTPNLLHMLALYTIAQTIRERVYLT